MMHLEEAAFSNITLNCDYFEAIYGILTKVLLWIICLEVMLSCAVWLNTGAFFKCSTLSNTQKYDGIEYFQRHLFMPVMTPYSWNVVYGVNSKHAYFLTQHYVTVHTQVYEVGF